MEELDKFLENFKEKTLIVLLVNIMYLPIFEIWYNYFKQYQLPNFLAISLDKGMNRALNNLGVKNIFLPIAQFDTFVSKKTYDSEETSKLVKLFRLKHQILKKVIDRGIKLLYCDTEAFWLKNVYPLMENSQYDINISISHHAPADVVEKWGFVLNAGFFMIRSNVSTRGFIEEFRKELWKDTFYCDQASLNRFLLHNNIEWKRDSNVENEGYIKRFRVRVKAMSDYIISREPKSGIYVYHPFLEGGMDKKLNFVKEKLALLESENNTLNC
jgi:hypothetical protein